MRDLAPRHGRSLRSQKRLGEISTRTLPKMSHPWQSGNGPRILRKKNHLHGCVSEERGQAQGPEPARGSQDPEELPQVDSEEELIPAERPRVRARPSREPREPEQAGNCCEDVKGMSGIPSLALTGNSAEPLLRWPLIGQSLDGLRNSP